MRVSQLAGAAIWLAWLVLIATVFIKPSCEFSDDGWKRTSKARQTRPGEIATVVVDESTRSKPQTSAAAQIGSTKYNRLLGGYRSALGSPWARAAGASSSQRLEVRGGSGVAGDDYVCATHCRCSQVRLDLEGRRAALSAAASALSGGGNLSRVVCESGQFTDLLTIDRRTHIIHISLPIASNATNSDDDVSSSLGGETKQQQQLFRMPRLAQFSRLREIIIIKLKFEVCDSEVFKRGQRLLRLRWNHNQLIRISKSCLRHLDQLIELNLDHNKLSELESALFSGLTSLRSLSVAHNRLSELAAHQFVNLSSLTALNLIGNSFKSINLHLFEPMQSSLRFLLLAKNRIKSFVYSPQQQQQYVSDNSATILTTNHNFAKQNTQQAAQQLGGLIFKNLIKMNVDENKFERIKLLQLHRFYNVKYLSIRRNEIATIRDKAFNGLKLVELNLAHNQLQTISKCAFCNSTIKRLVLSNNNISLPQLLPPAASNLLQQLPSAAPLGAHESGQLLSSSELSASSQQPQPLAAAQQAPQDPTLMMMQSAAAATGAISSQNMLILSQSIFGPLFGQLEYLDLSANEQLGAQLEPILEPLLKLEYLNLASVGLEGSLPSPSLFKNLRQLRYLNLSHNQLDQLVAETIEPLSVLEILDLSHNKFSELDESFLVTIDELAPLKLLNLGSNPWFCSQCKVAPLYDWILRSPIYNLTCIAPLAAKQRSDTELRNAASDSDSEEDAAGDEEPDLEARNSLFSASISAAAGGETFLADKIEEADLGEQDQQQQQQSANYNLLQPALILPSAASPSMLAMAEEQDDKSIGQTMALVASISMHQATNDFEKTLDSREYCLRCEFPSGLSAFHIHELAPGDFKFCAGAAPRFAASEPKIGLTLALVIIGALLCIIIVVIVMYRKKSNTYYTNEDMDQLNGSGGGGGGGVANGKKPVFSISSDEHENNHYDDGTDYSSPPMSRSVDSYSQEEDELNEDEDEEDEDEDEDEELDEDDEEDEDEDEDDYDEDGAGDGTVDADDEHDRGREADSSGGGNSSSGSQRQPVGLNVDSSQAPRQAAAAEEAKRLRQNQIDEYNRRNEQTEQRESHSPSAVVPKQTTSTRPESSELASSENVVPPNGGASRPAAGETNRLAETGRQATAKSLGSTTARNQRSSLDSDNAGAGAGRQKSVEKQQRVKQQHQQSTLSRNQSHPQQQRLAFAEQPSFAEPERNASSVSSRHELRSRQKSLSRDEAGSGSERGSEQRAPAPLKRDSSGDGETRARRPTITKAHTEAERTPTTRPMRHLSGSQERPSSSSEAAAAAAASWQLGGNNQRRQQHSQPSLDRRRHRQADKQSGPSEELDATGGGGAAPRNSSSLRRHQTSRSEQPSFSELRVEELPFEAAKSGHQPQKQANNNKAPTFERARHRFAASKELASQTVEAAANPLNAWPTSGGLGENKSDQWPAARAANEPPSRRGAGIQLQPQRGEARVGRQMARLQQADESPSGATSDATTADSLALTEPPDGLGGGGGGGEIDDMDEQPMNYRGGGALAAAGSETDSELMEPDVDDSDAIQLDRRRYGARELGAGEPTRLQAAVSSHSALTQTGSDDLLDC